MHFFKSKFFLIILAVALVLTIVPSVLSIMGLSSYVRNALGVVVSPFTHLFNSVSDAVHGFTSYFTEFDRLAEENEELKRQIAEMQDELYSARILQSENEWLYKYLDLRRRHTDYVLCPATVISRQSGNYQTSFTVDCGSMSGITSKMPVITDAGVVGYIAEAGLNWSKVVTILETTTSVGAYDERSGVVAVVQGDFALRSDGNCRLCYLSADADVAEGDRIYTSGLGEIYPRGLFIGTVTAVEVDAATRSKTAVIKPAVNLGDIENIMILTAYATTPEETAAPQS